MPREANCVLGQEKQSRGRGSVSSEGLWVGTEQKRWMFCLKELFALNRHPDLLIQGKGEEGKEGVVAR